MSATVRPQKLREALNAKLAAAVQCVFELQQAELPEFNRYQEPQQSIVDFLHAAHGVYPVVTTFAESHTQRADFEM
jgi:hypothetical protein